MDRAASLQRIAAWIQREDEDLLYAPDAVPEEVPLSADPFAVRWQALPLAVIRYVAVREGCAEPVWVVDVPEGAVPETPEAMVRALRELLHCLLREGQDPASFEAQMHPQFYHLLLAWAVQEHLVDSRSLDSWQALTLYGLRIVPSFAPAYWQLRLRSPA